MTSIVIINSYVWSSHHWGSDIGLSITGGLPLTMRFWDVNRGAPQVGSVWTTLLGVFSDGIGLSVVSSSLGSMVEITSGAMFDMNHL